MKNGRIWMVLLLILVVGILSTRLTRQYVTMEMEERSIENIVAESMDANVNPVDVQVQMAQIEDNALTGGAPVPAANQSPVAPIPQEETTWEIISPAEPVDSPKPAAAAQGAVPEAQMIPEKGASKERSMETIQGAEAKTVQAPNTYLIRLEELDAQIAKNRATDSENTANYSMKARAESSQKLWETELEGITEALKLQLTADEQEAFIGAQREWYRERDAKAIEASKKQSGSSLEEIEYTVSIAESTRARAYELVKEYEAVLGN